jgi:hypothetical protein
VPAVDAAQGGNSLLSIRDANNPPWTRHYDERL